MRTRLPLLLLPLIFAGTLLAEPALNQAPEGGGHYVTTRQIVRPAGETLTFGGRPVDFVLSPDGRRLYAKDNRGLVTIDLEGWGIVQELEGQGASMHGMAISPDGGTVYATSSEDRVQVARVEDDGQLTWLRAVVIPGPGGDTPSYPTGLCLLPDDPSRALVCVSRNNSLALIDLDSRAVIEEIPVGVAPYDVVIAPGGTTAYVANWGGRHVTEDDEHTAKSSGTKVVVDERGIAASGTLSVVDLQVRKVTAQIDVGLHPSGLSLNAAGDTLYVANANDDTVSIIDIAAGTVRQTLWVKPDEKLPFGSAPNALALDEPGRRLYVANGGNNAIAVVTLHDDAPAEVAGFIPAGWYPGALAFRDGALYVANIKGVGSRNEAELKSDEGRRVQWQLGSIGRIATPGAETLAEYTAAAQKLARVPEALHALERSEASVETAPVPVPAKLGEPSVFEHIVYIIKENRTYDQLFGAMEKGNGAPQLCLYGKEVTPNHHALADEFVLLDNYYCNGVNSADGHSWATEGNVTDHLEKSFGGFARSYTFGNDPLTYSSSGFIWDRVLAAGLSFRNYGEMDYAEPVQVGATFSDIYTNFATGSNDMKFLQSIGIKRLRHYSCLEYPGWNLRIPDVLRADRFLREFREFEKDGGFPNFVIIYLPQDHTSGTEPDFPKPASCVADNDQALGRIVEAVSRSPFWPKTCIFVNEDDPQDGFDHVDGHRSLCLVISPYTRRGAVVSAFYNQTAVLHTMARMLGVPPMNQMDASAPLMSACFTLEPNFTPYRARSANVPLDELNPPEEALKGDALRWARLSMEQPFEVVDGGDDDTLNRILWHAAKGYEIPYPAQLAGAHGSGLPERHLRHDAIPDND